MPNQIQFTQSSLLKTFPLLNSKQISTDEIALKINSIDASFYSITPKAIVDVETEDQVLELIENISSLKSSLTFRAAGTSLSGQAQGGGIVLKINKAWKNIEVLNKGQKIRLQPGVIGSHANASLAPYRKKIGPDPASIKSCMVGGIVANNASGMCCGTHQNSYQTIDSMKFILPPRENQKAKLIDTSIDSSKDNFLQEHADLANELLLIKSEISKSPELKELILSKYKIKNTMGYSLNSFLDFNHPLDILTHLLIGSEGTLGFISEVTLNTVENTPFRCCALAFFPTIREACEAASSMNRRDITAAELMDRSSLRSVSDKPGIPGYIKDLPDEVSALLVEVRSSTSEGLLKEKEKLEEILKGFSLVTNPEISIRSEDYDKWWDIRKGLLPSTGRARPVGTTLIIEDIAFQKADFPSATEELKVLLQKYYKDSVLFGHALDTNLHFVFSQDFNDKKSVEHYERFMSELGHLVGEKWKGSLKAEHGTGRNMAPFVVKEWGEEAYKIMKRIKSLVDPFNILNPGVIINDNAKVHVENLKLTPAVDPLIDRCIDCGFCEPNCPSRDLTLTPRLRISAFRRLHSETNPSIKKKILNYISYFANDTCATDGMCAIACPVDIDTGIFIKSVRANNVHFLKKYIATFIKNNFLTILNLNKLLLLFLSAVPRSIVNLLAKYSKLSFLPWMPRSISPELETLDNGYTKSVVYLSSCISRSMGPSHNDTFQKSLPETLISILTKAKYNILIPKNISQLCCGLPFESKGLVDEADHFTNQIERELVDLTNHGEVPVIMDNSPCTFRLKKSLNKKFKVYDSVEFVSDFIKPNISISNEPISIHITCSSQKMGIDDKFLKLAEQCSTNVTYPSHIKCCGFAGDKGFSHPELNDSALNGLKEEVKDCSRGFCSSRTCEIGISKNSDIPYQSLLYLVDEQMS